MGTIKNIIFDLGGVVIDLERERAAEAMIELGIVEAENMLGDYAQKGILYLLEEGQVSDAEMFDSVLPLCHPGTTCTDIKNAFDKFLIDLPVERLKTFDKLRQKGYRLFVLSNTNPIMFDNWIANAFMQDGKNMQDYFDGIVVSFQEQACKPNPKIFTNLLERYNLNPEETIFLDDSKANCEAAEALGIKAIQISPEGANSFRAVTDNFLN